MYKRQNYRNYKCINIFNNKKIGLIINNGQPVSYTHLDVYKRQVKYRREIEEKENLVKRVVEIKMPTRYGDFKMFGFVNELNGEHHVALVKGEINENTKVLTRVHSECLTGEMCIRDRNSENKFPLIEFRQTMKYETIEVEYLDKNFKKQKDIFTCFIAQII